MKSTDSKSLSKRTPYILIVVTEILMSTFALSISHAAVGKVAVNGEPIPDYLFTAYEQEKLLPNEQCSPVSDAFVRDKVIDHWLSVLDGRERKLELKEYTVEKLEKLKQEIESNASLSSEDFKAKKELDALVTESFGYASHRQASVSDAEAMALYKKRIADKDPTLTDVTVVRFDKVQFTKGSGQMEEFVNATDNGESWETLMEPLSKFARNHDKSDIWHTIADMDEYTNTTVQRLVGDGRQLQPNDVIGPIEMYAYSQIFRIQEQKILPVIALDQNLNGEDAWGMESSKDILRQRHFKKVRADLRAGKAILENGEAVVVPDAYPACD